MPCGCNCARVTARRYKVMLMKSDNSRLTSAKEPGRGYHDLGGLDAGPIDTDVTQAKPWEKLAVVVGNALGPKGAKVVRTDEVRRACEEMGADLYNRLGSHQMIIAGAFSTANRFTVRRDML